MISSPQSGECVWKSLSGMGIVRSGTSLLAGFTLLASQHQAASKAAQVCCQIFQNLSAPSYVLFLSFNHLSYFVSLLKLGCKVSTIFHGTHGAQKICHFPLCSLIVFFSNSPPNWDPLCPLIILEFLVFHKKNFQYSSLCSFLVSAPSSPYRCFWLLNRHDFPSSNFFTPIFSNPDFPPLSPSSPFPSIPPPV